VSEGNFAKSIQLTQFVKRYFATNNSEAGKFKKFAAWQHYPGIRNPRSAAEVRALRSCPQEFAFKKTGEVGLRFFSRFPGRAEALFPFSPQEAIHTTEGHPAWPIKRYCAPSLALMGKIAWGGGPRGRNKTVRRWQNLCRPHRPACLLDQTALKDFLRVWLRQESTRRAKSLSLPRATQPSTADFQLFR
jgi:hypothetical protein